MDPEVKVSINERDGESRNKTANSPITVEAIEDSGINPKSHPYALGTLAMLPLAAPKSYILDDHSKLITGKALADVQELLKNETTKVDNPKENEEDEDEGDENEGDENEGDSDEKSDQGYDEEGKPGEWTAPRNTGGSVWLSDKKDMCRVVNTEGKFMDLFINGQLDPKKACSVIGNGCAKVGFITVPNCVRKRIMIYDAYAIRNSKEINQKAAAVVLSHVCGTVIFCEAKFYNVKV